MNLFTILSLDSKPITEAVNNKAYTQNFLLAAATLSALGAGFFLNKKGKRISKFRLKMKLFGIYLKRFFSAKKKDVNSGLGKTMIGSLLCIAGLVIALSSTGFWLIFGILVIIAGMIGIGMGLADFG